MTLTPYVNLWDGCISLTIETEHGFYQYGWYKAWKLVETRKGYSTRNPRIVFHFGLQGGKGHTVVAKEKRHDS